jgi:ketosteroid isomerase-like protein
MDEGTMNDTPTTETEILALLDRHLCSIWAGDLANYTATTAPDVTFYEWYISTQRIDGLDFHLRETAANHRAAEARRQAGRRYEVEHEVLAPKVQLYGETAIVTYTLLMRYTTDDGVRHTEHNETRIFHRGPAGWRLVHCHKSPMWPAPHAPTG